MPEWNDGTGNSFVGYHNHYAASGARTAQASVSADSKTLKIRGVAIDTVTPVISNPVKKWEFKDIKQEHTFLRDCWRLRCCYDQSTKLDTTRKYPAKPKISALWAYMETMSAALFPENAQLRPMADRIPHYAQYLMRVLPEVEKSSDIQELAASGDYTEFQRAAFLLGAHKRFCVTSRGYYVLAPEYVKPDDRLCLLFGMRTPIILRPKGDEWLVVGECFACGLMFGEVEQDLIARDEVDELEFNII